MCVLDKSIELAWERAKLANEANVQARQELELAQNEMLEAHQANSKLGEELDAVKAANEKLRENVKKLSNELKESKRSQAKALKSYTRCKEALQTANAKLWSALEDTHIAFQKGREELSNSKAYTAKLEGVLRCGFEYMKNLANENFLNMDMDSIIFNVLAALFSLE